MTTEFIFPATPEHSVSAIFSQPEGASALLILAHGAGADMRHHHMAALADALGRSGIATLRFNFPFKESGGTRTDKPSVCVETIDSAVQQARARNHLNLPVFAGGHSFGGRMSSHFAAENPGTPIQGLVFFSFPLHPSKKPDVKRAAHLKDVTHPMLFLSGTRDDLADPELMDRVTDPMPDAKTHWLDTADHSFKILKRSRKSDENVYDEAARITTEFINSLIDVQPGH